MLLASRVLVWRSDATLTPHVPFMPIYWFLSSIAAWMALGELLLKPHHWNKTPHLVAPPPSGASGPAAG